MPNIREIVRVWLTDNGYSGLVGDGCVCALSDLFPCGDCRGDCEAGHQVDCTPDCRHDDGPSDCHMQTERPEHEAQNTAHMAQVHNGRRR